MGYTLQRSVPYLERLGLDADGQPTRIDVELPQSRADCFDLVATLDRLARTDPSRWKLLYRQSTATSWYMLGLLLSGGQRIDPFTGRLEMDCDFLWHHFNELQFDGANKLDESFRGSFKSHIRGYVGVINKLIVKPNRAIAIVASEKFLAARHGVRTMLEIETNIELKVAWDDVFFMEPRKDPDCPLWNQESGYVVRRTIPAKEPSVSWHAIEHVPTGARFSDYLFEDLETEDTVETDSQRDKVLRRFSSFKKTAGRLPSVEINGTCHHPAGLIAHIKRSDMYQSISHPAEDVTQPPPDIAKLYDDCDGVITDRETGQVTPLPPAVRDIRLAGRPVYHHPLELALMRLEAQMTPGGLADYHRQMLCDNLAGEDLRFNLDWIRYYDASPRDIADGAFLYIVVDGSKGIGDPTFARVEACRHDRTIAWVGGLRKKILPHDFGREIWILACQWEGVGIIREIRFEDVAQSTWDVHFMDYCDRVRHWPGGIGPANVKKIPARAEHWGGGPKQKLRRHWHRLQPLYHSGRRLFPREGVMLVDDENGRRFDLMKFYRDEELGPYPLVATDDGLDADSLLAAPEDVKRGIVALEFPESEEEREHRHRGARRRERQLEPETRRDSWMEMGL